MSPRTSRRTRGMSLIETMLALAVFSIGLLGLLQLNVVASGQNGMAMRESVAAKVGRDIAASMERLPYGHSAFSPSDLFFDAALDRDEPGAPENAAFKSLEGTDNSLHRLSDTYPGERPLLTAAEIATQSDLSGTGLDVGWRTQRILNGATEEGTRILIMIRFRNPAGQWKQINFWTLKYNPAGLTMGSTSSAVQEI